MQSAKDKYVFLEHTADAKFVAYGKSLEQAFSHAAEAFTAVLTDPKDIDENKKFKITITAKRLETLLFDFLDRLLFLLDTEQFLTKRISRIKIEQKKGNGKTKSVLYTLTATAVGDSLSDNYDISGQIKAMTYNDMAIEKKQKGYELTVVVDL